MYAKSEQSAATAANAAFERISSIEDLLTDYRSDSESMQMANQLTGQWVQVSRTLFDVLQLSNEFYILSKGAFDPTVGAYTHLWRRVGSQTSEGQQRIPSTQQLASVSRSVGFQHVELDCESQQVRFYQSGLIFDFGAIGKGYAADQALLVLEEHGMHSAIVDLGGDLAIGDPPPNQVGWRVTIQAGLHEPSHRTLSNVGVATSGDLERHYQFNGIRYSHIIDPRTGMGVTQPRSVTVISNDATTADATASIISVLGEPGIKMIKDRFSEIQVSVVSSDDFAQSQSTERSR